MSLFPSARPSRALALVVTLAAGGALGTTLLLVDSPLAWAVACTVTLVNPADGTLVGDAVQQTWLGNCSKYRVWYSPSGTFGVDTVRTPWQGMKKYTMNQAVWDGYQEGTWSTGVYWKVQGKAVDNTLSFSSTRFMGMLPTTRWLAVGDTGNGNAAQADVAAAMGTVCADEGCDFVLLLGDNIYTDGPESADPMVDPDWDSKFEDVYASLGLNFYPVMGNHDYGDVGGMGGGWPPPIITAKATYSVDHTAYSSIWNMPDQWYSFSNGDVDFFALDTTWPLLGTAWLEDEQMEMGSAILGSTAEWKIAYGHHSYSSNGHHGNAGNYDGVPGRGAEILELFDETVCGNVDLYIGAHDHSLQWMTNTCAGTQLMTSGGGSSTTTLTGSNPTVFQSSSLGFFWFEAQGNDLHVKVFDDSAVELYDAHITH